jgi:hypothetical protein
MNNTEQLVTSDRDLSFLDRKKALFKIEDNADREWSSYLPCEIFVSKRPQLGCDLYSVRIDVPDFPKSGVMTSFTQTLDQRLEGLDTNGPLVVSFRTPTEAERAKMKPAVRPPGTFVPDVPLFE